VEADGGTVLAAYREPVGGHWQLFALLPRPRVAPTPYQRDLSKAHAERLHRAIKKLDRFVDPVVAVRGGEGYWVPNGNHRRWALDKLKADFVPAILVPEPEVAFQILALNTEKAHNLKEKSLEVIRMYRGLMEEGDRRHEDSFAFQFEEPHNQRYLIGMTNIFDHIALGLPRIADAAPVLAGLLGLVIVFQTPAADFLLSRSDEASQSGSSGSLRFVQPYTEVFAGLQAEPVRYLVGAGPGTADRLLESDAGGKVGEAVVYTIAPKLAFEYGLIAAVVFMAFMLVSILRGPPMPALPAAVIFMLFFLSGSLLQPQRANKATRPIPTTD